MYYCKNDLLCDLENLAVDFINYRQEKKAKTISTLNLQCDDMGCIPFDMLENNDCFDLDIDFCQNNCCMQNLPDPLMQDDYISDEDLQMINRLYSELNQMLNPIIDEVLNEYEFDGSPTNEEYIERETLAQLIDRVFQLAKQRLPEMADMEMETQNLRRRNIFHSLIESLILNNFYMKRRPRHRRKKRPQPRPYL